MDFGVARMESLRAAAHRHRAVVRLAALHVAGAGAAASPATRARTSSRWARSCARCSWAGRGSRRPACPRSWPASSTTTRRVRRSCEPGCRPRSTAWWPRRSPSARPTAMPRGATWRTISRTSWPGEPRHAAGTASSSRGRTSDEDGLLAGLTGAAAERRGPTTHDPLASLLDEAPVPPAASRAGATAAAPAASTTPIGAGPPSPRPVHDAAGWCRPARWSGSPRSPRPRSFSGPVRPWSSPRPRRAFPLPHPSRPPLWRRRSPHRRRRSPRRSSPSPRRFRRRHPSSNPRPLPSFRPGPNAPFPSPARPPRPRFRWHRSSNRRLRTCPRRPRSPRRRLRPWLAAAASG